MTKVLFPEELDISKYIVHKAIYHQAHTPQSSVCSSRAATLELNHSGSRSCLFPDMQVCIRKQQEIGREVFPYIIFPHHGQTFRVPKKQEKLY